ncbi:MAG: NAD-dependent epimerase/dehydratase family protein [Candidatus Eisenbacteria bacterium]|nr:NAD-dependent epimerase/dehydratase family protein [Candidatus Eisenbacteria bacterium]
MSTMLVTGGAGFIGSHIVERLLDLGHSVRVLDDFSTGRRENIAAFESDVDLHVGDVRDLEAVRRAVDGVDVVFHEAALASVPRSVDDPVTSNEVNVGGTLNVLVAARDAGVGRLVYASSSSIYGDSPELPKREDMAPSPESPYAVGKLAGEHYCKVFSSLYGLECVALRYFNVFGPRQDPGSQYAAVVPIFTTALLSGRQCLIHGDGEQSRDFTYVANVVEANLLASGVDGVAGSVMNIACGDTITVNSLHDRLRTLTESDLEPEHGPERAGDVKHSYADVTRARELLGFSPKVPFDEGLESTVAWFRESVS